MKREDFKYVEQSVMETLKGLKEKSVTHGEARTQAMVSNVAAKLWSVEIRYAEMMSNPDSKSAYELFDAE
jgi:hypothetical protein